MCISRRTGNEKGLLMTSQIKQGTSGKCAMFAFIVKKAAHMGQVLGWQTYPLTYDSCHMHAAYLPSLGVANI